MRMCDMFGFLSRPRFEIHEYWTRRFDSWHCMNCALPRNVVLEVGWSDFQKHVSNPFLASKNALHNDSCHTETMECALRDHVGGSRSCNPVHLQMRNESGRNRLPLRIIQSSFWLFSNRNYDLAASSPTVMPKYSLFRLGSELGNVLPNSPTTYNSFQE